MIPAVALPGFLLLVVVPRLTGATLAEPEIIAAAQRVEAHLPGLSSLSPEGQAQAFVLQQFLMFNLLRPDVYPLGDLGLLRAVRLTYFRGRKVPVSRIRRLGEQWAPWRSVATWYLWRSLDPLPVEY